MYRCGFTRTLGNTIFLKNVVHVKQSGRYIYKYCHHVTVIKKTDVDTVKRTIKSELYNVCNLNYFANKRNEREQ